MSVYYTDAAHIAGRKYVIGFFRSDGTNSRAIVVHCKDNNVAEYAAVRYCMNHCKDVTVVNTDSMSAVRKFADVFGSAFPIDIQFVPRGKNLANLLVKSRKELLLRQKKC